MRFPLADTFAKRAAVAAVAAIVAAIVASCATVKPTDAPSAPAPTAPPSSSRYYADDGPPDSVPGGIDAIPDAVPRAEALHRYANRPYVVMGRAYVPATALAPYREQGMASWYGRKFHVQRTSTGEVYDMFAMTAAHPTLPIPSYARVTSVASGRSVVVRVNDRGPFLHGRIVDLSYAAAHRLGIAQRGSGEVVVESLLAGGETVASVAPVLAAPVPVAAGKPAEAPVQSAAGGFVVQLGAFSSEPNARSFLMHVQERLAASADIAPRVREAGGLYRVYVGPYPSRDDARRTAERLASAFGLATAVAPH
ncbi:MAG: septal ring lytic transglycosylase RlpA family protein [Vicinamibacteria bacterium]